MTWPQTLLTAQYLNLVDRMVRNHEIRQITADTKARTNAWSEFVRCLDEITETLSDFVAASPLRSHRVVRATNAYARLLDIRNQPYHGLASSRACDEVASLLLG